MPARVFSSRRPSARRPGLSVESLERRVLLTSVTLTNGTGDGTLSIPVNPYGSYRDAFYDPVGPTGSSDTTFNSKLFLSAIDDYLEEDGITELPEIEFTSTSANSAVSTFNVGGLSVVLTQTVTPPDNGGTNFSQLYQFTNTTSDAMTFELVRYADGDLDFEIGNDDFAGASADGSFVFEFDTATNPQASTGFFGISSTGGERVGYAIQPFENPDTELDLYQFRILDNGGIPDSDIDSINGDDDGDRLTDAGYDVTISLQNEMTLAAGQTQVFTTVTRFGQGAPSAAVTQNPLPPPPADPNFTGTTADFAVDVVAPQASGGVVVAGQRGAAGNTRSVLRRFNPDGSPDTAFGGSGEVVGPAGVNESINALAIDDLDRIVAAGASGGNFLLARFNPNGTPDATFGTGGRVVTDFGDLGGGADAAYALALGPDGSITLGGGSSGALAFARYTPAGLPDAGFGTAGRRRFDIGSTEDVVGAMAVQSDGGVVAVGSGGAGGAQVLILRLLASGQPDPTFALGASPAAVLPGLAARTDLDGPDTTEGLAIDPQDRILVANTTASRDFGILRLTRDGLPDTTFGTNGLETADFGGDDDADSVVVQAAAQGQILAVGTSGSDTGNPLMAIAGFDGARAPLVEFGVAGRTVGNAQVSDGRSFRTLAQRARAAATLERRTRRLVAGVGFQTSSDSHSTFSRVLVPGATDEPAAVPDTVVGTFGTVEGQKKPQALVVPGTGLVLSLKGGTGQLLQNAASPGLYHIALTGTSFRSALALKGAGGGLPLSALTSDGPMGKMTLPGADLSGTLFVNGPVKGLTIGNVVGTPAAPATLAASGEISKLTVGSLDHARVLSGVSLGADGRLGGGDDAYGAGRIRSLRSNGPITASLVGAGVDPVNGIFGDAGDHAVGGAASRIDKLLARGTVDTTTVFEAGAFGKIKKLGTEKVIVATDPRFHVLA